MKTFAILPLILSACGVIIPVGTHAAGTPGTRPAYFETGILDFESRVRAQTQIERVYYARRIWPAENSGPKPAFETLLPAPVISGRALDAVRYSLALERFWNESITPENLHTEVERMRRASRDPDMLRELFDALGGDAQLIEEALARPLLAERLIRSRFGFDKSLHAAARAEAEKMRARAGRGDWRNAGGEYLKRTIHRRGGDDARLLDAGVSALDETEYNTRRAAAGPPESLPPLTETADGFVMNRRAAEGEDWMEVETLFLVKRSFDDWWTETAPEFTRTAARFTVRRMADAQLAGAGPEAPAIGGCDNWAAMASFADTPQNSTPGPMSGHTAVWTGSEMIVWSGAGTDGTGGRYNPATDTWTPVTSTGAPAYRNGHSAVWTGSEMIVWGGTQGSGYELNTGGRYNPGFNNWSATSTGAGVPTARFGHTAVWSGTEMIVWGGANLDCPSSCTWTMFNSGGRYTPGTDSWVVTPLPAPTWRQGHTAVWAPERGEMIIWGGYNYDGGYTEFNDGGRFSPGGNTWTPVSTTGAPISRTYHTAVWTGSRMVIWSGANNSNQTTTSGGRYNPATDSWLPTSTTGAPEGRVQFAGVWAAAAGRMVVWGGRVSNSPANSGGRYDPVNDQWFPLSTTGAPLARASHTGVWAPEQSRMIVWGGVDGSYNPFNSGGRYNPAADSWTATPIIDGIQTRAGHTAIWTGAEMIIWGGIDVNNISKDSGGRYVPATDSWTPTAAVGAPSRRQGHTAVWTGSRMIIWGGNGGPTGGRYNPAANSWLSTSTGAGAPVYERSVHGAIWSGSRMVIWGGYGFDGVQFASLGTGYRYDPAFDTWTTVSTTGAVSPRENMALVWTGSEMLVWGGRYRVGASDSYVGTGGRYNPGTDTWLTMNSAGAPVARGGHSFAWAGGYLSVLHGFDTSQAFFDGGRYNVAGDTWYPMTASGMPSFRYNRSPVSTGQEMILWSGDYLANGARYNPVTDVWNATSTGGQPSARSDFSGVWTGNNAIFWGGRLSSSPYMTNTGGIYLYGPDSPGTSLRAARTTTLNLSWTAASGATGYNIYRCTVTGTPCVPGTYLGNTTLTSYSDALNGNNYFYSIQATNACGSTP